MQTSEKNSVRPLILGSGLKRSFVFRTIAYLVIITFFMRDLSWAQAGQVMWQQAKPEGGFHSRNIINGISIPHDLASIGDVNEYKGSETIINIQDTHSSLSSQNSIVKTLESLVRDYDLNVIAVEGSEGYVDTSILRTFPDNKIKKYNAEYLMKEGRMSAGEFFAVTSDKNLALYGIEDEALYKKNVELFNDIIINYRQCYNFTTALNNELKALSAKIYNKDLKEFLTKCSLHKKGQLSFALYWEYLSSLSKRYKVKVDTYKNLSLLINSLEAEKDLDFTKANNERKDLVDELSHFLEESELKNLIQKSILFKSGKISQADFHNMLVDLAMEKNINPKKYSDLIDFTKYVTLYESIDVLSLYKELDMIHQALLEKLIRTKDEKTLINYSRQAELLKGLFSVKLTNQDVEYLVSNKDSFRPKDVTGFISRACAKYGLSIKGGYDIGRIASGKDEALGFYAIAEKRNAAMIRNTVRAMRNENKHVAALITGGYHSEGLAKIMKEKGFSYLVLIPKFEEGHERPYITVLTKNTGAYEGLADKGEYTVGMHQYLSTGKTGDMLDSLARMFVKLPDDELEKNKLRWASLYREDQKTQTPGRMTMSKGDRIDPDDFVALLKLFTPSAVKKLRALKTEHYDPEIVMDIIGYNPKVKSGTEDEAPDIKKMEQSIEEYASPSEKDIIRSRDKKRYFRNTLIGAFMVSFIFCVLNFWLMPLYGTTLVELYSTYEYSPAAVLISGLIAGIFGAASERFSLILSDSEANKNRVAQRFAEYVALRLIQGAVTCVFYFSFINVVFPKKQFFIARILVSMVWGISISSLYAVFFHARFYKKYIKDKIALNELTEGQGSELLENYTYRRQWNKNGLSIAGRLPFTFLQHGFVQNIVPPSFSILATYATGYANSLFRHYMQNKKNPGFNTGLFLKIGLTLSAVFSGLVLPFVGSAEWPGVLTITGLSAGSTLVIYGIMKFLRKNEPSIALPLSVIEQTAYKKGISLYNVRAYMVDMMRANNGIFDRIHFDIRTQKFIDHLRSEGRKVEVERNDNIFDAELLKSIHKASNGTPIDVHLMDIEPGRKQINQLADAGAATISIHTYAFNSEEDIIDTLEFIRSKGLKAGLVISLWEPVSFLSLDVLEATDFMVISSVPETDIGGEFSYSVLAKMLKLRNFGYKKPLQIQGGINSNTIQDAAYYGANIFVSGSYALGDDLAGTVNAVAELKKKAREYSPSVARGPPSGLPGIFGTKTAPGTPALTNMEMLNLQDLVDHISENGKSEIVDIPEGIKRMLAYKPKIKDPEKFIGASESFIHYLESGRIKFVIDDLKGYSADEYLYPRFNVDIGILGFFTYEFQHRKNNGIISYPDYVKLNEDQKTGYKRICLLHIPKAVWDKYADDPARIQFFTQLLIHEWVENFIPSYKEMTCHTHAGLMEKRFLSTLAREKGVSDIDMFFLRHAARTKKIMYFQMLFSTYSEGFDITFGDFFKMLTELTEEFNLPVNIPSQEPKKTGMRYDPLPKKMPGSAELTNEEIELLKSLSSDLNKLQPIEDRITEVSKKVKTSISNRGIGTMFNTLTEMLNEDRIRFIVDDLSDKGLDSYGITDTMLYPRLKDKGFGVVAFIEKHEKYGYLIHISRDLYQKAHKNHWIMCQILIHIYAQNFMPQMTDFSRHALATLQTQYFSSQNIRREGISDLDYFLLDHAKNTKNVEYFYYFLQNYHVFKDPIKVYRKAIFSKLKEIENETGGEELLIRKITSGRDLLAWYSYKFETINDDKDGVSKAEQVTAILTRYRRINPIISHNLRKKYSDYLFKYRHPVTNRIICIPQNIVGPIALSSDVYEELELSVQAVQEIRNIKRVITKDLNTVQQLREALSHETKEEERLKIVEQLNVTRSEINYLREKMFVLRAGPFVERMTDIILKKRSELGGRRIVVGIYGAEGSGKTTLRRELMATTAMALGDRNGIKVNYISADSYLHPGSSWRQKSEEMFELPDGQPIYNRSRLYHDIVDLKNDRKIVFPVDPHSPDYISNDLTLRKLDGSQLEVLFVEIPSIAIDNRIAGEIDVFCPIVLRDEKQRLDVKVKDKEKDIIGSAKERIKGVNAVVDGFVANQLKEQLSAMLYTVGEYADYAWEMDTNRLYDHKEKQNFPPQIIDTRFHPHDYLNGPIAVADLAYLYSNMNHANPGRMNMVIVDSLVNGEKIRMKIPVPKNETPEVIRNYLRARLFNIMVIAGPIEMEIYISEELEEIFQYVKRSLFHSSVIYSECIDMAEKMYDGRKFVMTVNNLRKAPKNVRSHDEPDPDRVPLKEVEKQLAAVKKIEGLAVGVDIGGSDLKLAVMDADGIVVLKEYVWEVEPKNFDKASEFYRIVNAIIKFGVIAATLKRLDKQASAKAGIKDLQTEFEAASQSTEEAKNIPLRKLVNMTRKAKRLLNKHRIQIRAPDSIGISFPDIISGKEIVGGMTSKTRHLRELYEESNGTLNQSYWDEFNSNIRPLADIVSLRIADYFGINKAIPTAIANDGDIGSYWASVLSGKGGNFNFALGTSLGGGLVDESGRLIHGTGEPAYLAVLIGDGQYDNYQHNRITLPGSGQQLVSQDTVFTLSRRKGLLDKYPETGRAEVLKQIQNEFYNDPEKKGIVEAIFNEIGIYLAFAVATLHYAVLEGSTKEGILFGRVVKGKTGQSVLSKANEFLRERFSEDPDLSQAVLTRASELPYLSHLSESEIKQMNALAQAVGACYLGNAERLQEKANVPEYGTREGAAEERENYSALIQDGTALIVVHAGDDGAYGHGDTDQVIKDRSGSLINSGVIDEIYEVESNLYNSYLNHNGRVMLQPWGDAKPTKRQLERRYRKNKGYRLQNTPNDYSLRDLKGNDFVLVGGGFNECHLLAFRQMLTEIKRGLVKVPEDLRRVNITIPKDAIYENFEESESGERYLRSRKIADNSSFDRYIRALADMFASYRVVNIDDKGSKTVLLENSKDPEVTLVISSETSFVIQRMKAEQETKLLASKMNEEGKSSETQKMTNVGSILGGAISFLLALFILIGQSLMAVIMDRNMFFVMPTILAAYSALLGLYYYKVFSDLKGLPGWIVDVRDSFKKEPVSIAEVIKDPGTGKQHIVFNQTVYDHLSETSKYFVMLHERTHLLGLGEFYAYLFPWLGLFKPYRESNESKRLKEIFSEFSDETPISVTSSADEGLTGSNNWVVQTEKARYILSRQILRNTPDTIKWETDLKESLRAEGLDHVIPKMYTGKISGFYVKKGDFYYTLQEFKEGEKSEWGRVSLPRMVNAAKVQAQFHDAAFSIKPSGVNLNDSQRLYPQADINRMDVMRDWLHKARDALPDGDPEYRNAQTVFLDNFDIFNDQAELIINNASEKKYRSLPKTIIHGDFNPNNLVFDDDDVSGVFDLDYARETLRITDLANGMIDINWAEDIPDLSNLLIYLKSYESQTAHKITDEELHALPDAFRAFFLEGVSMALYIMTHSDTGVSDEEVISFINGAAVNLAGLDRSIVNGSWEKIYSLKKDMSLEAERLNNVTYLLKRALVIQKNQRGTGLKQKIQDIKSDKYFTEGRVTYIPDREGQLIVVGDTHGDYMSVSQILKQTRFVERLSDGENLHMVFLGDMIDECGESVKNLELLLSLKIEYPEKVTLLRGNHDFLEESFQERILAEKDGFKTSNWLIDNIRPYQTNITNPFKRAFKEFADSLPVLAVTANGIVLGHNGVPSLDLEDTKGRMKEGLLSLSSDSDLNPRENQTATGLQWEIVWSFINSNEPEQGDRPMMRGGALSYCKYWVGERSFNKFMDAIGGKILLRGHAKDDPKDRTIYDDRVITIISTGKQTLPGERYKELTARFGVFDLSKEYESIDPEEVIVDVIPPGETIPGIEKGKGSVGEALITLYTDFNNNVFTAGDLIKERGYSETTVRMELEMLEVLGLVERKISTRPYKYKLKKSVSMLPRDVIDQITALDIMEKYEIPPALIPETEDIIWAMIRRYLDKSVKDKYFTAEATFEIINPNAVHMGTAVDILTLIERHNVRLFMTRVKGSKGTLENEVEITGQMDMLSLKKGDVVTFRAEGQQANEFFVKLEGLMDSDNKNVFGSYADQKIIFEPNMGVYKYENTRDPDLELDEYDRDHYFWDDATFHWRSVKNPRLILGSWKDVKLSDEKDAPPVAMENHVAIRLNEGYTIYVFDDHGFAHLYLEEANERGEIPRTGNKQIFIDEHPDTFLSDDYNASIALGLAKSGWIDKHIWVFFKDFPGRDKSKITQLKNLAGYVPNNYGVHYLKYFDIQSRPTNTRAIINLETDAADEHTLESFVRDLLVRDRISPSAFMICTSQPTQGDSDAYGAQTGFGSPEGYGSVKACAHLAEIVPGLKDDKTEKHKGSTFYHPRDYISIVIGVRNGDQAALDVLMNGNNIGGVKLIALNSGSLEQDMLDLENARTEYSAYATGIMEYSEDLDKNVFDIIDQIEESESLKLLRDPNMIELNAESMEALKHEIETLPVIKSSTYGLSIYEYKLKRIRQSSGFKGRAFDSSYVFKSGDINKVTSLRVNNMAEMKWLIDEHLESMKCFRKNSYPVKLHIRLSLDMQNRLKANGVDESKFNDLLEKAGLKAAVEKYGIKISRNDTLDLAEIYRDINSSFDGTKPGDIAIGDTRELTVKDTGEVKGMLFVQMERGIISQHYQMIVEILANNNMDPSVFNNGIRLEECGEFMPGITMFKFKAIEPENMEILRKEMDRYERILIAA